MLLQVWNFSSGACLAQLQPARATEVTGIVCLQVRDAVMHTLLGCSPPDPCPHCMAAACARTGLQLLSPPRFVGSWVRQSSLTFITLPTLAADLGLGCTSTLVAC